MGGNNVCRTSLLAQLTACHPADLRAQRFNMPRAVLQQAVRVIESVTQMTHHIQKSHRSVTRPLNQVALKITTGSAAENTRDSPAQGPEEARLGSPDDLHPNVILSLQGLKHSEQQMLRNSEDCCNKLSARAWALWRIFMP